MLLVGLSIPLILCKVPPNAWYGFRTRLTLENPGIWYPVNAWASRRLCALGAALVVVALVGLLVPEVVAPWYAPTFATSLIAAVSLILVGGIRCARRLAREHGAPPRG
jgi:hypothetical protein